MSTTAHKLLEEQEKRGQKTSNLRIVLTSWSRLVDPHVKGSYRIGASALGSQHGAGSRIAYCHLRPRLVPEPPGIGGLSMTRIPSPSRTIVLQKRSAHFSDVLKERHE